jgi:myosin heavy subunit
VFLDGGGRICGAANTNYLLEKSRVVGQTRAERNYHVFFQLCRGGHRHAHLGLRDPLTFAYLNRVDSTLVDNVNDADDFLALEGDVASGAAYADPSVGALHQLGLTDSEIENIFEVTAAVLHLGDIGFRATGDRASAVATPDPVTSTLAPALTLLTGNQLAIASRLLQVAPTALSAAFTTRVMQIKGQASTTLGVGADEAVGVRDAAAKFIYARLFDWLVARINVTVSGGAGKGRSIGVLDIFG